MIVYLDRFGDAVRRWAGSPAMERQSVHIADINEPRGVLERVKESFWTNTDDFHADTLGDKLYASAIDAMGPVWKGMEYAMMLRGIEDLLPTESPKIAVRLLAGFNDKMTDVIKYGPITAKNERVPGFENGVADLISMLDKTNEETLTKELKQGLTFAISERVVAQANKIYQAVADRIVKIETRRLNELMAKGDITKEEFKEAVENLQEASKEGGVEEILRRRLLDMKIWEKRIKRLMAKANKQAANISGAGAGIYADNEQAAQALQEVARDSGLQERLKRFAEKYRKWARSNLEYARDKGRISAKQFNDIVEKNEYYVAMNRIMDDVIGEWVATSAAQGKPGKHRRILHKFKGSRREIENPLVSLIQQTAIIMREADRNEAMQKITNLLTEPRNLYEGPPLNLAQIGARADPKDKGTITVWVKGEPEYWKFEENIHKALKDSQDIYAPSLLEKSVQTLPRILHDFIVYSPAFPAKSTVKDILHRPTVSRTDVKVAAPLEWIWPGGPKDYTEWLSLYRRYGGGLFGHYRSRKVDYEKEIRDSIKKLSGAGTHIFAYPGKALESWKDLAAGAEIMGRVTEFKNAYKYAKERLKYDDENAFTWAAFQGRDITDYAVAGSFTRQVNRYLIFMSASVRGIARTVEGTMDTPAGGLTPPKPPGGRPPSLPPEDGGPRIIPGDKGLIPKAMARLFMKWMTIFGSISTAVYLLNLATGNIDEWRQQPAWLRDRFWLVKTGNQWLAIPKPWEMGIISSVFERALDYAITQDGKAWEGFGSNVLQAVTPFGPSALVGPFGAWAEAVVNYALFRGRNIVPYFEQYKPLEERNSLERSSRLAGVGEKVFRVDARKVDHILKGQFADIGVMAGDLSDVGREDKTPLSNIGKRAFGFVRDTPSWFARDVQWVFEWARNNGQNNSSEVQRLRRLVDLSFEARGGEEKNDTAARAREYATELRERIEWREKAKRAPEFYNPYDD